MTDFSQAAHRSFLLKYYFCIIETFLMKVLRICTLLLLSLVFHSCKSGGTTDNGSTFCNPVWKGTSNTSMFYHDGLYYHVHNRSGWLYIRAAADPADIGEADDIGAINLLGDYGLEHLWHPQIIRIDGKWFIYTTADDGNTDNHKMYVAECTGDDPLKYPFRIVNKIVTDKDDNWAMHGNVFEHKGSLYMIWSGWKSRRAFAETQCIYIARMSDPYTIEGERVMISEPEYDWEKQWINEEGISMTRYPVFVNEAPFFFCNDDTDKAYIYYSASANWTPFCAVGQLSADKDSDLLDPASWKKDAEPVFKKSEDAKIYGPWFPYIITSPDGKDYFLVYLNLKKEINAATRWLNIQKIEIKDGVPVLGEPIADGEKVRRITCPRP